MARGLQWFKRGPDVRDAKPRIEPYASARTGWVACEADPTKVPVKTLP